MRDIIHLVLYELTVTRGQRFHSISRDVTPFIWQNWDKLMLPTEVSLSTLQHKSINLLIYSSVTVFKIQDKQSGAGEENLANCEDKVGRSIQVHYWNKEEGKSLWFEEEGTTNLLSSPENSHSTEWTIHG
jgi:hypothetical protein